MKLFLAVSLAALCTVMVAGYRLGGIRPSGQQYRLGGIRPSGQQYRLGGNRPSGQRYRLGGIRPGGMSPRQIPASQAPPKLLAALRGPIYQAFADRTETEPSNFELISFTTQVVAGVNYFAKVRTGDQEFAHLRIFEHLPYTKKPMELHSYQLGKGYYDRIAYF